VLPLACDPNGGSSPLGWLVLVAVLATWVLVTALLLRMVRDRTERRFLLGLVIGSIVFGPGITAAYYAGLFGSDSSIAKLALLLAIPGVAGAVIAHLTHWGSRLRAFFAGVWGAIFLLSAGVFLFIVAFALGDGGCLE
jgi:hypothetical protein